MNKSFSFLYWILVCSLLVSPVLAQSQPSVSSSPTNNQTPKGVASNSTADSSYRLTNSELVAKIGEARSLLKSRPTSGESVNLAVLDPTNSQIGIASVTKVSFLRKGTDLTATTQAGNVLRIQVIRPNGVNTAVSVTDLNSGRQQIPLLVQYPIVKSGVVTEEAYYTSAHPALISSDLIAAGNAYVTTMLEAAAKRLSDAGIFIPPDVVNIAEHLVIVEHTDHRRFLNDDRTRIYPEILSLYALNQGDTFRYSVSSAGAGGMIQMIPRTYAAIREQHPQVSLISDFESGMRNHANALVAMLLYLNDTWNFLQKETEVQSAVNAGLATKSELLAAGYNSNPMRLPTYLKNGGAGWRSLIPSETQLYLTIYSSVDRNVQFASQPQVVAATESVPASRRGVVGMLIDWFRGDL